MVECQQTSSLRPAGANANRDFPPTVKSVQPARFSVFTPTVALDTPTTLSVNAVDVEQGVPCCEVRWRIDGVEQPQLSSDTVEYTLNFP